MKRALTILTVLLLISMGFVTIFQYSLLKEKDQVNFTDEIRYGDQSAAEGITVTTRNHYDRHLFWDTAYEAGTNPSVSTDYTFYSTDHRIKGAPQNYFYIDLDVQSYYLDMNEKENNNIGIDRAFYDLYHDNSIFYKDDSNTLQKSKLISLKDYYEYYPLTFHASIDDDYLFFSTMEQSMDDAAMELSPLAEYFRIPIIEDDTRMIHLYQYGQGDYSTHVEFSESHPSYFFDNFGVVTDDALFYTFSVSDSFGNGDGMNKLDFSHIPGGYGIYRIPYSTEKKNFGTKHHIDSQNITMAYPLDKSISIFSFTASKDNAKLFLAYQDKDSPDSVTEFAVIDAETMETLQVIPFEGIPKEDGSTETLIPHALLIEEEYIVLSCSSEYLVVLERNNSGLYEYQFTVNIHENPVFEYYVDIPWRTALDWNGTQLAVAGANTRQLSTNRYALSCGFYLAIFDKDGLIYYSEHDSSLDKGPSPEGPYKPVQPLYNDDSDLLLSVKWE